MRGRTSALKIEMDSQTRKTLLSWLRRQKTPVGLAKRARAMLLLAEGQTYSHTSKQVGLSERHLRKWFVFHYPPVHCSWMNQVEQWFSILQRKRLRIANFADKEVLAERLQAFIAEWNAIAHPFNWTRASVAKVMAKCEVHQPNLAITC